MNNHEYGLTPRGRRALLVSGIVIGLTILFTWAITSIAAAEADIWDKSSITLEGVCLPDGSAQFTVTNAGADMAGPTAWREYEADVLTQDGDFQLAAGASQVWTFGPRSGVAIRFEADQRPGHPGSSAPRLTLTCSTPTALTLTTFRATSGGNRAVCAEGNKVRGLSCVVTAFAPGYVSGTCDGGLAFRRVRTARTFRLDQVVTASGCIGGADGWTLTSAPGMPLRIR